MKNGCRFFREQVADAVTAEKWYHKYGHDVLLAREEMFVFFFKIKHATTTDNGLHVAIRG